MKFQSFVRALEVPIEREMPPQLLTARVSLSFIGGTGNPTISIKRWGTIESRDACSLADPRPSILWILIELTSIKPKYQESIRPMRQNSERTKAIPGTKTKTFESHLKSKIASGQVHFIGEYAIVIWNIVCFCGFLQTGGICPNLDLPENMFATFRPNKRRWYPQQQGGLHV